ncbi:hypothetical protein [Streptomyces sp. NPDC004435]|uniref:hypothetical protein n=1 Tax=Streptomyces sp. NPDC004435 TaxID=3364701 RepID=UPI003692AE22
MFTSVRRSLATAALALALAGFATGETIGWDAVPAGVGVAAPADTIGWDSTPAGGTPLAASSDTIGWD